MKNLLVLQEHFKFISSSFKFSDKFGTLSIHWNNQNPKAVLGSKSESAILKHRRHFVRIYMCLFVTVGLLCHKKYHIGDFNNTIISACFIVMYFAALTHMQAVCTHGSEICQYINGNMSFSDSKTVPGTTKVSFITKISVIFAYSLLPIICFFPILFVYGLHMLSPCKTSLLGYWLLPECRSCNYSALINGALKLTLFFCNHYIWLYLYSCVPADLGVVVFLCSVSFTGNINQ